MKKYIFGATVAVVIILTVMGANSQQNLEKPEKQNREISLKIGEVEVKTTYESLGISVITGKI
ncbi:hypothetical protein COY05_02625 [Candidatus Peregrinibacteria bacterium CG_4_10_14_0_2_um_filter_38_24]|nr:MAG: hypothetical protein COY05_02625 [Candidatus Peregrinibacteria bacterium CG_4_10_14_0_2_um_filter_38_24]PJC38542.1 MAG: hypothetical protein CO044_04440 [Candidatus Peregrinibacteria bacterium CG_4_9_14_0_2_um_filter_38_9]